MSQPDVYQVSEGREGVVVNSILEHHEYVLPLRNGELVPSKPPLLHWLSAAFAVYRGAFGNFELRFVSSVAATLLIGLIGCVVSRLISPRVSLLSCGILLSTYGYRTMGSDGRVDMLLCFLFCASVYSWYSAYHRLRVTGGNAAQMPRRAYRYAAIFAGFAVLTKGPLGLVLPLIVIGSFLLLEEGWRSLRSLWQKNWIWSLVIPLPWYVAASIQGGRAFFSRFLFENAGRFYGGEGITQKPPWFYLSEFWGHALPWSFIFAAAMLYRFYRLVKYREPVVKLPEESSRRMMARFCFVWMFSLLVFYSLSAGKRSSYLLTILPPFSILLALWLDSVWPAWQSALQSKDQTGNQSSRKLSRLGLGVFLGLILSGVLPVLLIATPLENVFHSPKSQVVLQSLAGALHLAPRTFAFSFSILVILGLFLWIRGFASSSVTHIVWGAFLGLQAALVVLVTIGLTTRGLTHGYRDFAERAAATAPRTERVTFIKKKLDESFDGFFFYFGRTVYLFEPGKQLDDSALPQEPGWYLARNSWINQQPDRWTKRVEKILTGGRRVDTPEQQVSLFRLNPEPAKSEEVNSAVETPEAGAAAASPQPPLLSPSASEETLEDR